MKKMRFLLGFLSKKGILLLGILIGIVLVLLMKGYDAQAFVSNDYGFVLISGFTTGGGQNGGMPIAGGLSMDFQPDITKVCLYLDGGGTNDGGAWTRYRVFSSYENIQANYIYNWHYGNVPGRFAVSMIEMHDITKSYVYIFSSRSDAESYISGKSDAANAINYEEIQSVNAIYDSSISAPSKLYIDALSASSVTSVWEYSGNSYEGLQYEVQVENYYAAQSFAYAILGGYSGSSADQSFKLNGYINSLNQLTCEHTVEGYLKNPSGGLDEEILVSGIIDKSSGDMHSINTYISIPVDYSDQFVSSGIPFFQGATNAKHPVYLGSQVTVIPYRVIDGVRYKGNTVVCRRFVNPALNALVGSTFTEIGSDSNGNSYINRTENVDITGESTSGSIGIGDTGTFFSFLNQLMDMLVNQGALLGVFNNLLSSVPAYIWVLIGFSIVVGIVAMIVKFA